MKSFSKIRSWIIVIFIVAWFVGNVIMFSVYDKGDTYYRVEAKRIAMQVEKSGPSSVNLSECKYVTSITAFTPGDLLNGDYIVAAYENELYAVGYSVKNSMTGIFVTDVILFVFFLILLFSLYFIDKKIVRPFNRMSDLTVDLAKGNLSTPIKAEKSRIFGRFLWGMDMLRENLEESKKRELEYQKEKKTMILSLSHDIKTPLSAIELYTKALEDGIYDTKEKQSEALSGILKNVNEIKDYAGEINKLSRDDFLKLDVKVKEAYLDDVIFDIEKYYKDKLSVLHTLFEIEKHDNCLLKCDPDRLVEALQNMIENAIKYGDGEKIAISFSDEEDCRLISIFNTGRLPDDTDMENIFDSFYRGKNVKNVPGSGLGLYICKNLLRKMDGDVFATGNKNGFTVTAVVRKA